MSTAKEGGFEGPLPSSIKPGGFHCHRRGGCDREALCEREGECHGAGPLPANALTFNGFDDVADTKRGGVHPSPARALNRCDEIAEMVRTLPYGELIEFASILWSRRGKGKLNSETLPKILHAWATRTEWAPDCTVATEPSPRAGEYDCDAREKFQPIDTAPKDRPILAFMLGRWRIARWKPDHPHKRPVPFWSADDLRVTVSRAHQPKWWAELPPSPPDAEA